jgi:ABC-type cobalamin/Fe3+-siderophores transport system ATPase subunit
LLRQIGGLLQPTAGTIACNGRLIQQYRARDYARICSYCTRIPSCRSISRCAMWS